MPIDDGRVLPGNGNGKRDAQRNETQKVEAQGWIDIVVDLHPQFVMKSWRFNNRPPHKAVEWNGIAEQVGLVLQIITLSYRKYGLA